MSMDGPIYQRLMDGYDENDYDQNGISGERLAFRLNEIAKIGLTNDKGSNRPGFSEEELAVKSLVSEWMEEAGLEVNRDGAGNIIGRLSGSDPSLPTIMSGSHVDSIPNGGHFDGPLGVLLALEVVEAWKAIGYHPRKSYEVIIFSDEEGARFNGGLLGSQGMTGDYDIEELKKLISIDDLSFEEVLKSVGLSVESYEKSLRDFSNVEIFVEVHIEQGKRLEKLDLPCGIVNGIAGPYWLEVNFTGKAGHAGNTPMDDRTDALVAASEFITKVSKLPRSINDTSVATIGKMEISPNGVNVIPGEVKLFVDIRDIFKESRNQLVDTVILEAENIAKEHQVSLSYTKKMNNPPVPIKENVQLLLEDVLQEHGITPVRIPSGAGHDAMIIGKQTDIAMIFVKSIEGISHNPSEWSTLNDCVQTAHVLKGFIEKLNEK
ncbi:Zn-dependent hydrolase [Robertmurraya yapensis]|uniref:Zn-dependent hydrolase n=1 Tax=Bacillus yapensis TaxID=2492960 RepID=A0A431WLR7_9BACI|nr:M20 family metallo-hydrolase [Bacillus yapensis]RTR36396.1 Zn-dependent hydrolase [Bacillus yapensis]TKT05900.1 hydantoinase/carbamoylase family amidase [Bacillus yapensis]